MMRNGVLTSVVCAALLCAAPVSAARYYGFAVGVTNAPPPPVIRQAREPHVVLANDAMVYVVDDASLRFDGDLFRYGQYWFAYSHGFWYRARAHSGPYAVMDVRKIPRAIIGVPRKMWKHHPLTVAPGRVNSADAAAKAHPAKPFGPPAPRVSARAESETFRSQRGSAR